MVPRGMLPILGIVLAVRVFFCGVWFLSLSLAGFGFFTLKSTNPMGARRPIWDLLPLIERSSRKRIERRKVEEIAFWSPSSLN